MSGSTIYLVNSDGLQILDVSNPLGPSVTGTRFTPGVATGIDIEGTTAYIADGWKGGLQIIDISNPISPDSLGSYDTRDGCRCRWG